MLRPSLLRPDYGFGSQRIGRASQKPPCGRQSVRRARRQRGHREVVGEVPALRPGDLHDSNSEELPRASGLVFRTASSPPASTIPISPNEVYMTYRILLIAAAWFAVCMADGEPAYHLQSPVAVVVRTANNNGQAELIL